MINTELTHADFDKCGWQWAYENDMPEELKVWFKESWEAYVKAYPMIHEMPHDINDLGKYPLVMVAHSIAINDLKLQGKILRVLGHNTEWAWCVDEMDEDTEYYPTPQLYRCEDLVSVKITASGNRVFAVDAEKQFIVDNNITAA